jgi:hypothetical protein
LFQRQIINMLASILSVPALLLALTSSVAAKSVSTTPHDKYSSSVGVLGCKINTNRVAYWPGSIDCDHICIKLSYEGRSVNLLRIDQSGGAHDISYDAWAYLQTGKSATDKPITGGGVAMEYEEVDASECADLIYTDDSKLPLSASNSINYLSSCLDQPNSWVAKNHVLYNICDAICTLGYDEECELDLSVSNQPSCPHSLGLQDELTSAPVYDIAYESGDTVNAGTGEVGDASDIKTPESEDSEEPEEVAPQPTADSEPTSSVKSAPSSVEGGVFVESASSISSIETDEPVPESSTAEIPEVIASPTEIPTTAEAPVEISTELPVISSTTPLTTLATATSTPRVSTSVVSSTTHVSPSHSTPLSSPTSTPPPESAAHSMVHVPFLLLVSTTLLCLIFS